MVQSERPAWKDFIANIKQEWNFKTRKERKGEGFCNFTLSITLIWNLGLIVALQIPQYGPLADHSI